MKHVFAVLIGFLFASASYATDLHFYDIHVSSPSGRFRVDATSPDNKKEDYKSFQNKFQYEYTDTSNGELIWTRKQPMKKPRLVRVRDHDFVIKGPTEGSPCVIYISDSGTTTIYTSWEELIVVCPLGQDMGKISLLDDALTTAEYKEYVRFSTAGPQWTDLSVWYYLETSAGEFFVVRPWWGRRIFVDTGTGMLAPSSEELIEAATEMEKKWVLVTLASDQRTDIYRISKKTAAYLAGVLDFKRAIPLLRAAEQSTYSGSSTSAYSSGVNYEKQVNPHSYSTFTLRQVAQLSLRRLGEVPENLPCHEFSIVLEGKSHPFVPRVQERPRHELVNDVKVGMSALEVLNLIGSPDFMSYDQWSYDMNAPTPFTITFTFNERAVTNLKKEGPLWKSGRSRDEALIR